MMMTHEWPGKEIHFKKGQVKVGETSKLVLSDDKHDEWFDKIENDWKVKVREILTDKYFNTYLNLKKKCDEDKMNAYEEFQDELLQMKGSKLHYHLSQDISPKEKKIGEKCNQELLKIIGEENFKIYLKARDQFNENLRRQNQVGNFFTLDL